MDLLDRPSMIKMLDENLRKLSELGNADVQRIDKELQRESDDVEMWFDLGLAYNQSGLQYIDMSLERARLDYLEQHPDMDEGDEAELKVEVAAAYALFEKALSAFDRVLELMPEYYGVQCQKGVVYGNMHRYEEAVQCYLKALEEDEEDYAAAYYLGCAYRDMGDEELAKRYFAMAEELNGGEG